MSARSRLLIIGPTPPPFIGPAVNTRALLAHPELRGRFDVSHLDTSDRRDITNSGRFDWTNVALALRHGARYLTMLARHRPDLVYFPISPSRLGLLRDLEFLVPAVLLGTPVVLHQRGGRMQELYAASSPPLRRLLRFLLGRVSRVVVLGEHFRPDFAGLVSPERIVVVPNGVVPSSPIERSANAEVRVLYMGILMEAKGYRFLLEVARRMRASTPRVVFQFAGEYMSAAERQFTEGFVRAHDLASSVELLGVVSGEAKRSALARADVFAFPTAYAWEGHPTVLLEAMDAGLPIASTRHVAIPETIVEGEEGFLVDTGDVDALTARIAALANDPALRARMGARARQTLVERFTLDRCVRSLIEVFDGALQDGRP